MQITFIQPKETENSKNIVVLLDTSLSLPKEIGRISSKVGIDINSLIKLHSYKAKKGESLNIPTNNDDIKNIMLFGVEDISKANSLQLIKIGGSLNRALQSAGFVDTEIHFSFNEEKISELTLGILLADYKFNKYKTKKEDKEDKHLGDISIVSSQYQKLNSELELHKTLSESISITKDLTSEPANVINPETLTNFCKELSQHGLEIEVLDEEKLTSLGMGAILGVGQGSVTPSRIVVMKWNGNPSSDKIDVALVGKGVTFDSGGLSIKPAAFMEDMKTDMGGSAIVIGMMRMLALRKSQANIIGAVGLAENMVDAKSQRPGDIVKSMSGQTIEVLNTDAEGRLVLADVLWYIQDLYKPNAMINIATLTGAIRICLSDKMAGLFSNDDKLADSITKAGESTGERFWRLPLDKEYDKMIDSDIADMKNIGSNRGDAGSTTAAQFLQRFVNNNKWAHIDIASTSTSNKAQDTGLAGPTAFGFRALNKFIQDNYER